jgi:hypothetical protein
VTQITNQVINRNVTSISNVGDGAQFSFNIEEGDNDAFVKALVKSGIAKQDAQELAKIMASEKGGSEAEPFGTKAKAWIVANIGKSCKRHLESRHRSRDESFDGGSPQILWVQVTPLSQDCSKLRQTVSRDVHHAVIPFAPCSTAVIGPPSPLLKS